MTEPETKRDEAESPPGTPDAGAGAGAPPPRAEFLTLVSSLAGQAFIHLGLVEHPIQKKVQKDLRQARYTIDLLGVLEEKTRGNLDGEERAVLARILADLRMRYVEATRP